MARRLYLEVLEDRTLLSTYLVTNTGDNGGVNPAHGAGTGTLRQAIVDANYYNTGTAANPDLIQFAISTSDPGYNPTIGVFTIQPKSSLPGITDTFVLDGYTQAGASPNTLLGVQIPSPGSPPATQPQGDNAVLKIQLDLSSCPAGLDAQANNITIRGLVLNDLANNGYGPNAIGLDGTGDQVQGCFIGTDVSGRTIVGGGTGTTGIFVNGLNDVIGGATPDARNIIAGFDSGLTPGGGYTDALVEGNFIGTNASGRNALGNQDGVHAGAGWVIGGTAPGAGNLISGNQTGIGDNSPGDQIQGNLIGTDVTGMSALGNDEGIFIDESTTIGGTTAAARNIISGNSYRGIFIAGGGGVIEGNYIGTDITGTAAVGNDFGIDGNAADTIGGTAPGAGNLISGNNVGVGIDAGGVIQGNLIGTDYKGTKALANNTGIDLFDQNNLIGGIVSGARNIISGNRQDGISISGSGNVVESNYIGTDITGTTATGTDGNSLGNGWGIGLGNGATGNTIGGTTAVARNIISGNGGDGVNIGDFAGTGVNLPSNNVVEGNYIGTDVSGTVALHNTGDGVDITDGSSNNTIGGSTSAARNIISGNGGNGGLIQGGSGNVVQGNFIGTDVTGKVALGNAASGVSVSGSSNNTIGGTDTNAPGAPLAGAGNLISGQANFGTAGIAIGGSSGNAIQGNYVGTDVTGSHAIANMFGLVVESGASANRIGTTGLSDYGDRNVISGNVQNGVAIIFAGSSQNVLGGNFIGTDATGSQPLGNGGAGVAIGWTAQNNQIGGLGPLVNTLPNTIAFNGLSGVWVISDSTTGANTTSNSIRGNSIHDNAGLGIDLGGDYDLSNLTPVPGPDGVTPNDTEGHAAPNNPNNFQDFPILAAAVSSTTDTSITGTFRSGTVYGQPFEPNEAITLDFYANPAADPSGYGQGETWLGSTTVITDANGTVAFTADLAGGNLAGQWITATATDPSGNTSEFARDVQATAAPSQTYAQYLQAALPQSSTTANSMTIQASASIAPATVIQAVNGLTNVTQPVTIILDLGGGTYSSGGVSANPPSNVTFVVQNGTLDPASSALTVGGGHVSVLHCTLTTSGNAPTLLVTGGSVTLRDDDIVQTSSVYTDPAIAVSGGSTVDLGTAAGPGGNTLSVNGTGQVIVSTGVNVILTVGDSFQVNGAAVSPFANVTLASSVNPSLLNEPVTFTVTVSAPSTSSAAPAGNVTFLDTTTGTTLAVESLSAGSAQWTTSTLPVNAQTIAAVYSGDVNYITNAATAAQQVHYHFSGFLPPLSNGLTFAVNRTIPITFTLSDFNGKAITSLSAITSLQIQALDANGNPVGSPFTPTSTNKQGLQYSGGQYQFNWQTKGLTTGSYEIMLKLADGTTHTQTIKLTAGGSSAGLVTDGSSGTATAGALLGGEVDLYVDNSNGDLTSDELARIQDAVTSIDTTIAPFGVVINAVSDPTQANVTLNMNTTSSLGGVAQGVLGCTTDADQVTMIQGWGWYAGADPTQIGSGQYDFETAVMHELGHVLGLGHSSSSNSVMYATLATGTANRALVTADLNVPDDHSGPCALHAAPAAPVSGTTNSQDMPAPSSTSIPSGGNPNNGSPMSGTDQLFANFTLLLGHAWNAYQSELSSVAAMWQSVDALALQRLDALLSMEAGAMGVTKDTLLRDSLFASNFSTNGV
jgi:hypothetical protein